MSGLYGNQRRSGLNNGRVRLVGMGLPNLNHHIIRHRVAYAGEDVTLFQF